MKLIRLLLVACALVTPRLSYAGQIAFKNFIDESDEYNSVFEIGLQAVSPKLDNVAAGQVFHSQVSGMVESVSAFLEVEAIPRVPLLVEIHSLENGAPGELLGVVSTTLAATPTDLFKLQTIDFTSAGVQVTAGIDYFAEFRTDQPYPNMGWYDVLTVVANANSTGHATLYTTTGGVPPWQSLLPYWPQELGLAVTVVPEPATASELLIAAWLVASCYSRSLRDCR
jgi:hypothetical protein